MKPTLPTPTHGTFTHTESPPVCSCLLGGLAQPEFSTPIDILHLCPGLGEYTCCARAHDFGDGPGTASCDLIAVAEVLNIMIDAKVEHLWSQAILSGERKGETLQEHMGDQNLVFEARVYAGLKHWFMRGLNAGRDSSSTTQTITGDGCAVAEEEGGGLEAAKRMFRWRGKREEAEETRRSGVDLLFWCSLADNLGAVRALATEGNAFPGGRLKLHRPGEFEME